MALNPIARRALALTLRQVSLQQTAAASSVSKIGSREVVGFGFNGTPCYVDRVDFPMPGVRFKENTPDIQALREKEKGDWTKLTLEEKKALYRASFCQTFAEMKAPTGEWKSVLGISLIAASLAVWVYMWMKLYVYSPIPETLSAEKQEAQLKRMIALRSNPVQGLSSQWDYSKGDWK
ncbi:cytochrome c oxidase subunit 4 isoform 1, mitochondrial-like [Penaeus japonicus]|uniref:cytochrome c oxidase subunit 4 isoform 1, mitochondrial-like n=1 Tax=Penaeus japonicus TaxID=27405 RepID=UPI001C716578|nr:cytochrome c oxidase subunit 4 isoform 1, mitochondrial-like [Penaeus japonicus]XP_042880909.1 cytochrome c oxidase subunit 4 isoform 1, mitochondrial-like [Penaeus japonicus]XP_042880910.1 cytochrome c oxidase subunit 4 isoform 1, mitochondrial-like [Penaeus japonicus]XP_042880911.1 cytochrome c oxidase subunit 4 isoform 1, mitochondrial-like [Penaeus japonicus]